MPKKVDPRKYNLTENKIRGSWWFLLIEADGEESLAHYSPVMSIADVIRKGKGNPDTHVAKFGSKVLDNNNCLEDYKINTNGSRTLNDYDWDGQLSVVQICAKNVVVAIMSKLGLKKSSTSESQGSPINLQFHLCEAVNLPGVDTSGTSDPYVVLSIKAPETIKADKPITAKSATIKKNVNPKWNETVSLGGSWLTEQNYKEMKLFVQVYDANVVQKDVLIGDATIDLKQWFKAIEYHTHTLRSVWIPLKSATNAWIRIKWVKGEGKPDQEEYIPNLFYDGSNLEDLVQTYTKNLETTFGNDIYYAPYKSDLNHVIRFLDCDFFRLKRPEQKSQVTVVLKEAPSDKWNAQLLSKVDRFILEARGGKSEDVKKLLEEVKKSTVSEVHLLDFDESLAMEEGMTALKGSTNIKSFLYTDDDGTPNQILIDNLIDLAKNLPSLETLTLQLGQKLWKSPLVVPLLQAAAKLKLKSLLLSDLPKDVDLDFGPLLSEITAEKLELNFRYAFEETKPTTFDSLVNGLKSTKLPKIVLSNIKLTDAQSKKLVEEGLTGMPNLVSFAADVGEFIPKYLVQLVKDSKNLKHLYIDAGYDCKTFDADSLLDAAAASPSLVALSLSNTKPTYNTTKSLAGLFKNTNLKKFYLNCNYNNQMYSTGSFIADIKQNTTLEYACVGIFSYNALGYTQSSEIDQEFAKRNAKFCTS